MNTLRIGDTEHELDEVILHITDRAENEWDLEIDLHCDCEKLLQPGFALNCFTLRGKRSWRELAGLVLEVGSDDDVNEVQESVICEPGETLRLDSLRLVFGEFDGYFMPVRMDAIGGRTPLSL